ncbi:MAG: pyridoxal phosphate-dependent aminotransferase [Lachnospiraceae bacterium]|nr:pyridoxal phosphate-dependent aminotransferase [Lachnospiraceae bacterium]
MFEFDSLPDRRKSASSKWMVGEDVLPMWVADMDFPAAPAIIKAMQERISHGIFGYDEVTDEWYDAYIKWWDERHGFKMNKEGLIFCTGVIPALSSAVRKFTTPGEKVLIQTPVYNIFFNSILNNGCKPLESPLKFDGESYHMDMLQLEKDMSDPQVSLMLLCNPQNPGGRIWSREELAEVGRLAKKYSVIVFSDEIHCDIARPGKAYVPFLSVSDECREVGLCAIAPTKAFNIAGIHTAAVYSENKTLCHKIWRALNTDEVAEPNTFACIAAAAAFNEGGPWLDEMCAYVFENRRIAEAFIEEKLPQIKAVKSDATYLMWLKMPRAGLQSELEEKVGLYLSEGKIYGQGGEGFLRMNLGCSRETLKEGLRRLANYFDVDAGI